MRRRIGAKKTIEASEQKKKKIKARKFVILAC